MSIKLKVMSAMVNSPVDTLFKIKPEARLGIHPVATF